MLPEGRCGHPLQHRIPNPRNPHILGERWDPLLSLRGRTPQSQGQTTVEQPRQTAMQPLLEAGPGKGLITGVNGCEIESNADSCITLAIFQPLDASRLNAPRGTPTVVSLLKCSQFILFYGT